MVPFVASNPIVLVSEISAAGLIAGTVPTIGKENAWRNAGSTTVLAVLHATTTRSSGYFSAIFCTMLNAR